MDFEKAREYIIQRIEQNINPNLFYHNLDHTLDVLESATQIAANEKLGQKEFILLKTACLYHDSGMLIDYGSHEEQSCKIAKDSLDQFNYSKKDIESICDMIMATKLPQQASTIMQQIICDADLDYLGRDDFFMISHRLRLEWIRMDIINFNLKDWYANQIQFLESHQYFTNWAKQEREAGKQKNLEMIKEICSVE
ncbi:MAG: HD domain-containing protein [Bacteroidales bacterium]|nr:HD domain-containing protein [Bacteroidales bacterium]MCF8387485.1 HD domain-containing protein [Bacteroidales bacterium]MCF8398426.1 HD domain-containing protein [Bacteroidales bacterium]